MNAALRSQRLRALGVEPLRLRAASAEVVAVAAPIAAAPEPPPVVAPTIATPAAVAESIPQGVRKLALQPDPVELENPAIQAMYSALTEAVGKAGLQRVRVCDVAADPAALVMVFGNAPLLDGVPAVRVVRVDPLSVLLTDRERKRLLWERMQALAQGGRG